jgi:hypothetical protein
VPRTKDTEFFLKNLRELGGSAGNKILRAKLHWRQDKYLRVRKVLIEERLVKIGRGPGGSVYLLGDASEEKALSADESKLRKSAKGHDPHVVGKLKNQLNSQEAVIEPTTHQDRKPTVRKSSRPDVLVQMPKMTVFVACPYMLFPIEDYKKVFETIAKGYHVTFKFADEQITSQHILTKISNYIREHDISLFDITGWNPNVALELGIAVGMGRKYFILLNTHIDVNKEAPSDIRGIERIQYTSNQELEAKMAILIKQELPNNQDRSESAFESIKSNITKVLGDNLGIGIIKISELARQDKAIVQSVVRAMVQSGDLRTQGQRKGTVYYLQGG